MQAVIAAVLACVGARVFARACACHCTWWRVDVSPLSAFLFFFFFHFVRPRHVSIGDGSVDASLLVPEASANQLLEAGPNGRGAMMADPWHSRERARENSKGRAQDVCWQV